MTAKQLIRKLFDLWLRMRWLKLIDRECHKRDRYREKAAHSQYIVAKLMERYKELYPD